MFPATLKARFLGLLEAGMDKIPRDNLLSLGYCVLISDELQNWMIPNSLLSLQWLATVSSNTFCLYICTSSIAGTLFDKSLYQCTNSSTIVLLFLEDIQKWLRDQKYNCDLALDYSDHFLLEQDPISCWPE